MSIVAVIPARAGSRRLPSKNITPLGGEPLLLRKIRQLQQVPEVSGILVSSDSDDYLEMADRAGAWTHKRRAEFCDEVSQPFGAVVREIAQVVPGTDILWACCTSPLVGPDLYREAIRAYGRALGEGFDSLMSVQPFKRYLWDDNGPLNYRLGLDHVPSQQLPTLYFVTDGILLAPRERMIEWAYFHGPNPYRFVLDKRSSVDVDDALDMAAARAWADL